MTYGTPPSQPTGSAVAGLPASAAIVPAAAEDRPDASALDLHDATEQLITTQFMRETRKARWLGLACP